MNRWLDPTELITTEEEYWLWKTTKDAEAEKQYEEWMEAQYQADMEAEWQAHLARSPAPPPPYPPDRRMR